MHAAPLPADEPMRLSALRALGVLNTAREERFDRLTRLAARRFGVPIALITLVDADRIWFKSSLGLEVCQTARDISFCGHAIGGADLLVVPDAALDQRFADNPLVTGEPHIRFYAGAPIAAADGCRVGTLCIIDHQPRRLTDDDLDDLRDLGAIVERELSTKIDPEIRQSAVIREAALDSASYSIISADADGVISFMNSAAERWLGYKAEELVGKETPMLFHDAAEVESRARALSLELGRTIEPGFEAFVAKVRNGGADENEWTYVRKDGTRFPVLLSVTALRDEEETIGFMGIAVDITERKQAEKAERRLAAIVKSSEDAIYRCTTKRVIASWNPAAERMYGYPLEEIIGRPNTVIVPIDRQAELAENYERLLRGERISQFETVRVRKNGERLDVALTMSSIVESGKVVGVATIARDITERKRALADQAEHSRLSAFTAELGKALTLGDSLSAIIQDCTEVIVQYLNVALARIWTLDRSETMLELQASAGMTTSLEGPHSRIRIGQPGIGRIAEEQIPLHSNDVLEEPRFRNKDWARKEGIVAFVGHPLVIHGRLVGVMAIYARQPFSVATLDVLVSIANGIAIGIERMVAQQALQCARDAAEGASRAKSEFLANMSHELRTPLNSVIGFANILLKNKPGNLQATDITYLTRILENGKHLLELINQVLDLSKIEAGRMSLDLSPIDLNGLVKDTLAQMEGHVRDKNVRLIAEIPPDIVPIRSDFGKLKQVLINLLGNALKFTATGSVTVRVKKNATDRSVTSIEVADTGIGIPPDKRETIFQAFRQADNTTARKYGGTGLGLTISRSLCELMGYRLELDRTVGQGSTFRIVLKTVPAVTPKIDSAMLSSSSFDFVLPPAAPSSGNGDARERVLVIDDDLDSQLLLAQYLEDCDCQVICASGGEEGVKLARQVHPTMIILDLLMPGMDGWQVLKVLKADPALRDIPTIVISTIATEKRGSILESVELIDKPVSRESLQEALKRNSRNGKKHVLVAETDDDLRNLITSALGREGHRVRTVANGAEALKSLDDAAPALVIIGLKMPVMDGWAFLEALRNRSGSCHPATVVVADSDLTPPQINRLRSLASVVLKKEGEFLRELKRSVHSLLDTGTERGERQRGLDGRSS